MDTPELRQLIDRLRRGTRAPDVIALCDAADELRLKLASKLVTLPTPLPVTLPSPKDPPSNVTCPACLAKAEANRKRVAKFRAK